MSMKEARMKLTKEENNMVWIWLYVAYRLNLLSRGVVKNIVKFIINEQLPESIPVYFSKEFSKDLPVKRG